MKSFFPVVLCGALLLQGCAFLGIYRYKKAVWAPPEEADTVRFPDSMEKGVHLTGPMMAALKVAMDDYLPPWTNPEKEKTPEGRCLSRWDVMDTTVMQAGENLFFVRIIPDFTKCAPGVIVLDAGAVYAIDGQGRILDRE